jgi:hypothetical protein
MSQKLGSLERKLTKGGLDFFKFFEGKEEYVVVFVLRGLVVVDIGHRNPLPVQESTQLLLC